MTLTVSQFSHTDLGRIERETFVARIEFHRELPSTNDLAIQFAGQPAYQTPLLVLAEKQSMGRGRGGNDWWSDEGALTFSILLESDGETLPMKRWPQVSLSAGLAVCEAVERFADGHDVRLKWPNDVYVNNRKVCGILAEAPGSRRNMLVIGIGVNVNNSLIGAPSNLQLSATAICDIVGRHLPLSDVLISILQKLEERLGWIGTRDEELCADWQQRCLLTGEHVRVTVGSRSVEGHCRGIDEDGALVLATEAGVERCFAGVVTRLG